MPFVGERLKSTPKISPWGRWSSSPENTHPNYHLEGESLPVPVQRAEVRKKARRGQHSGCSVLFCLVYGISQCRKPVSRSQTSILQVGIKASAQWGGVKEEIWGPSSLIAFIPLSLFSHSSRLLSPQFQK